MRSRMVFTVIVGAALLVGACSSAATPGSSAPTGAGGGATAAPGQATSAGGGGGGATVSDPCSLLTQAEISTVVGQPFGAGSNADDPKSCDWQYPADGVPTIQAMITIEGGTLSDYCGMPSSTALGLTITQVVGVGDGACFTEIAGLGAGTNLTFSKNGQVFSVSGSLLGPDGTSAELLAADKVLALDALARL
jgi:hypothetical protein